MSGADEPSAALVLVDVANVVGSRPTGWWRDRAGAARKFCDQVRAAAASGRLEPPIVLVVEGAARRGVAEGSSAGVEVVHAAGSGDDTLVELAAAATSQVLLISSDRQLRERVARQGGRASGPSWLLDRLEPS
ncbi:MAG: hypothetical protein ACYCO3_02085 [Mycobacteriales bacterium]